MRDVGWELEYDGWKIVQTRAHTVNFATLDDAVAWFLGRFAQLERAGLLNLLLEFRPLSGNSAENATEEGTP